MLSQEQKNCIRKEIDETWDIISTGKRKPSYNPETGEFIKPTSYLEYDVLYKYATEDMRSYFRTFGKVETALTIGASGDQPLNFIDAGAKEVDVFDINRLSKRGIALKVNSVKTLTREQLFAYYKNFSIALFKKVSTSLKEEDNLYWKTLYEITGSPAIKGELFPYVTMEEQLIKDINPYLDSEAYPKMKEKIENAIINYIDSSLYNIEKHIKGKMYDVICLSNIYEYLNGGGSVTREKAKEYYNFVMETLYPHLNEGGTIIVSYLYAFNDEVKNYVEEVYKTDPQRFLMTLEKNINVLEYYDYLTGLTDQNLSYCFLLDAFARENIIKVPTKHVVFGRSFDTSCDMAVCLKK